MNDGVKFIIDVTDAQVSTDLTNFLKNVIINGATQNADGSYTVEQGKEYGLTISCAETTQYQLKNDGTLTYTMPTGVEILTAQKGTLNVSISTITKTIAI